MTGGGPVGATDVMAFRVFEEGFKFFRMGFASAGAMIIFTVNIAFHNRLHAGPTRSGERMNHFSFYKPRDVAAFLFLVAVSAFALIPILWGLSTSLKTAQEVHAFPPTWIPNSVTLEKLAWRRLFRALRPLPPQYGARRARIACPQSHAIHSCGLGNGPLPFLRTRYGAPADVGHDHDPGVSIVVPLYMVAVDVGLYDTLWVLVLVYSAWLVPTLVWLLRGFVASVPAELEESARMDGCTVLGAFYRVTLPLTWPGLIAGSILVFVMIWNDFLIGYSLTLSDENRLIQVGIYYFITETGVQYGPLMAAAIASVIPVLALYALLQRYFIQGLTGGAVKG
jgi:ABC-type glycerol-3-phosphate transport system permease component